MAEEACVLAADGTSRLLLHVFHDAIQSIESRSHLSVHVRCTRFSMTSEQSGNDTRSIAVFSPERRNKIHEFKTLKSRMYKREECTISPRMLLAWERSTPPISALWCWIASGHGKAMLSFRSIWENRDAEWSGSFPLLFDATNTVQLFLHGAIIRLSFVL